MKSPDACHLHLPNPTIPCLIASKSLDEAFKFLVDHILKISHENVPRPSEETVQVSQVPQTTQTQKPNPDCC